MSVSRLLYTALTVAGVMCVPQMAVAQTVAQAAARAEQQATLAPTPLALDFRLRVAQALRETDPEGSRKRLDKVVAELGAGQDVALGRGALQVLAELSPKDAVALVPHLHAGSSSYLIGMLSRANHREEAAALLRRQSATMADPLSPANALWLAMNGLPEAAAESYERVIRAVAAPDYGQDAKNQITATLRIGQSTINTDNTRDTLLLLAGSRLRASSPERFEKFKDLFAKWKLEGPAVVRSLTSGDGAPAPVPEVAAISKRISTLRGLSTDRERATLTLDLVREIRALPAGAQKLGVIRGLSGLATEGDLGKEALGAVASALAASLRENPSTVGGDDYINLAKLARYEHLDVPADASLDAALALLALREQIQQERGFTATGMDGKAYSLAALKGHIVLLNFWATWCPPCRKEMPDMEKLYRAYEKKGLVVLAVSDEDRATVEQFLAKNKYSFTVALDPDRKVNESFSVDGIPKSFVFDREGRLAAQAIDMRTESQFLELLKMAGLE